MNNEKWEKVFMMAGVLVIVVGTISSLVIFDWDSYGKYTEATNAYNYDRATHYEVMVDASFKVSIITFVCSILSSLSFFAMGIIIRLLNILESRMKNIQESLYNITK